VSEANEQAYHELVEQLHDAQQSKARQDALFAQEKEVLQAEITRLREDLDKAMAAEQERVDRYEKDLTQARVQAESDFTALRTLEQQHSELASHVDDQREALARALADANAQTLTSEALRQELVQIRAEFHDVKELEARSSEKVANLLEEQTHNLQDLEEARTRGTNLEGLIQRTRTENEEIEQALVEAEKEKDRLLRAQAADHDRIMRDHITEADGDRAVLEHQLHELKAIQEDTERRLKDAQSQNEVACADAVGLREELQRVERELREVRHIERVLRDDLKAGRASQSNFEHQLESSGRLIAQILDVAISFWNSHVKALSSVQAMTSHPNSASKQSAILADSAFSASMRHSIIGQPEDPSPIDPSDPASALETLRAYDHDLFMESISKTGSTIRKWQKQCKEYRERAKGKISFRNFAKGDLALFLPTRNSVSKPWAAFNGVFRFQGKSIVQSDC
jgi:autophagy-related protein 11